MVEDEAAKAEAENPDADEEEADEDGTGEPEPEPDEAGEEQASMEAALAAFEKENERHAVELAAIMGEDFAAWDACTYCSAVGFSPLPQPKRDPATERCEVCGGLGYLLTDATNPSTLTRSCLACQGEGFVNKITPPDVGASRPQGPSPVARYDPYTGQPLPEGNGTQPAGTWAPGYSPGGQPVS